MRHPHSIPIALTLTLMASTAAQGQSAAAPTAPKDAKDAKDAKEFVLQKSDRKDPKNAKLKATDTEAAMRLTVVDKNTSAGIPGVVVCFTAPDGKKYYADETDADGFTELLVPINKTYEITYLSLGRSDITAKATVDGRPNHNINLTLRYKGAKGGDEKPRVVLEDVYFDSGNAKLRPESLPRLDRVYEYMAHKKGVRIEISGHTDNVGVAKENKALSLQRAKACRDYLVKKGIDGTRIVAVGHGDEKPIASNDAEEGRQKNRRIEAIEL